MSFIGGWLPVPEGIHEVTWKGPSGSMIPEPVEGIPIRWCSTHQMQAVEALTLEGTQECHDQYDETCTIVDGFVVVPE